tara:strand:- start:7573 stop:7854 length:282 start_codon:yes stop_codon:yes gene_type:complete
VTEKTTWPEAACCAPNYPFGCICPPKERALRAWERGDDSMPPMTERQRAYCLHEIGRVEGYRREDYVDASDRDLAHTTIIAWLDYAADKGLTS